jgi:glutamate---cysteine ligase / carboxylate-amine ligase
VVGFPEVSRPKRPDERVKSPSEREIRALFEHDREPTFGVEEEVMVLDPQTFDLAPWAGELLAGMPDRRGVKLELPASQLGIVTAPRESLAKLTRDLYTARTRLAEDVAGRAVLASAGAHPFAAVEGQLNRGERYERNEQEYGSVMRRQLVCGLHVHVGLAGADRVLAVYNALRSYLPELAALGANAPVHGGRDSGMASVRPGIAGTLPRQGVPPAYRSLREYADDLAWGTRAGRLASVREWWWELRLHAQLGTIEIRVPDAQTRVADAAALAGTACSLVLWLAACHDAGELPRAAPSWRIAENRWSAARHGVHGKMADLVSGASIPTSHRLDALLDAVHPFAALFGGEELHAHARQLASANGADQQRAIVAGHGCRGLMSHLAAAFLDRPRWLEG